MANRVTVRLEGKTEALQSLNKEIQKIERANFNAIHRAGFFLRRKIRDHTPVETGTLRASNYFRTERTPEGVTQEHGYSAEYAPFLHDKPGTLKGKPRPSGKGRYWGPRSGPGWFLDTITRNARAYLDIIRKHIEL